MLTNLIFSKWQRCKVGKNYINNHLWLHQIIRKVLIYLSLHLLPHIK